VGHENADADHAKQCSNDLDHDDGPLRPARTKRHGRPHSQKKSPRISRIAARLMISGNKAGSPATESVESLDELR
jgi:hypothetical protein